MVFNLSILGLLIYVSLKHTCYRSRGTFLSLKQYSTSLGEDAIFVNVSSRAHKLNRDVVNICRKHFDLKWLHFS